MAATADSLQREVEALQACCPVLCPAIVPKGYDTQDLVALLQNTGKECIHTFEQVLGQAASSASTCCVCGADGSATGSSSASDEEDEDEAGPTLFFTLITGLDFKNRSVVLERAGFACTQCRALRSTCRMIRFAALRVGSESSGGGGGDQDDDEGGDESDDSGQRLLVLAAHLAAVNGAPAAVQSSPEALAVWLQELYCRAYALQVVASNLSGWRAVGPDGQPLSLGRDKGLLAAVKLLLLGKQQRQHRQQQQKDQAPQKRKQERARQAPQQQALKAGPSNCAAATELEDREGKTVKTKKKPGPDSVAAGAQREAEAEQAPEAQQPEQRAAKKQKKAPAGLAGKEAAVANGSDAESLTRKTQGAKAGAQGAAKEAAAFKQPSQLQPEAQPQKAKKKAKRAAAAGLDGDEGGVEEEDGAVGRRAAASRQPGGGGRGQDQGPDTATQKPAGKKRGVAGADMAEANGEAGRQRAAGGKAAVAPAAAGDKASKAAGGGSAKAAAEQAAVAGPRQVKKPKLAKK